MSRVTETVEDRSARLMRVLGTGRLAVVAVNGSRSLGAECDRLSQLR